MDYFEEVDEIVNRKWSEKPSPDLKRLMQPLPFNTCFLDHEYCLNKKKCGQCPKMGRSTT